MTRTTRGSAFNALSLSLAAFMAGCSTAPTKPQTATFQEFALELAERNREADHLVFMDMIPGGFTRDESKSGLFDGLLRAAPLTLADGTVLDDITVHTKSDVPIVGSAIVRSAKCISYGEVKRAIGASGVAVTAEATEIPASVRGKSYAVFISSMLGSGCVHRIGQSSL